MHVATLLKLCFFVLIVRPLAYVVLGLNVRHWERLPKAGPGIIVANHNSHLDTLVLMSLLPLGMVRKLRPVAAADYFLRNRVLAWFATRIMGVVPISRAGDRSYPLSGCFEALRSGDILILFPEGSRGTPETGVAAFKHGVQKIASEFPDVPVYPVFLHGLGKALPKGEALLVPFFCDVFVGSPTTYRSAPTDFASRLHATIASLGNEADLPRWQ